jgi:hypothetical protein
MVNNLTRIGPLNVIVPCSYISAIVVLAWISAKSLGTLLATSIMYSSHPLFLLLQVPV